MKISVCMIVKNEEENLNYSLAQLYGIVDEIIVVDTGSTDHTVSVSKQYGAKVFSYLWQDDFAAAKNYALSKAKGDWIVFLDADEYFSESTVANLRLVIGKYAGQAEVLLTKMINIDKDNNDRYIDEFFTSRIFKRTKDIAYRGGIHEQLTKLGQGSLKTLVVSQEDLLLYHTGYSSGKKKEKASRNLAIILRALEQNENPENFYAYLAEIYSVLDDYTQAIHYARLDIASGRKSVTYASRSYRTLIQSLQESNAEPAALRAAIEGAMQAFPDMPEFHAEYALQLAENFDYVKAIAMMQKALLLQKNYTALEPSIFKAEAAFTARKLIEDWSQAQQLVRTLKISACVIVKNEAVNIVQWLQCIKQCSDEQIVVDTGSTDDTAAIALQAGAKVYQYPWDDHFGNAKNYAIDKAKGDWILFLDADEYFAPSALAQVREVIAREHPHVDTVDAILCTIINIDADQNDSEISRFINLRLFRNVDYLRYQGSVHESIYNKNGQLRIFIDRDQLQIYHTGYSRSIIKEKIKRNLNLLIEETKREGEKPQQYHYFADCYHGLGEHEKAIAYAKRHIEAAVTTIGSESTLYRTLINSMDFLKKNPLEVEHYLKKALALFPAIPDFYAYYAANLFRQNKRLEAKPYLEKALEIYRCPQKGVSDSSCFSMLLSETYAYLAEIFLLENNGKVATQYLKLALSDRKYNGHALHLWYALLKPLSLQDKVTALSEFYGREQCDVQFIVQVLEMTAIDETYFYYTKVLEKEYNIVSSKTKKYRLLADGKANQLYEGTMNEMITRLQTYIITLLLSGETQRDQALLPASFQKIVNRYGGGASLEESEYAAYKALLPAIITFGNAGLLIHYLQIGQDFEKKLWLDIAIISGENSSGAAAAFFYDAIFAQMVDVTADVYYWAGVTYYAADRLKDAVIYFEQAAQRGSEKKDIASYITWIEERI